MPDSLRDKDPVPESQPSHPDSHKLQKQKTLLLLEEKSFLLRMLHEETHLTAGSMAASILPVKKATMYYES